MHTRGGLSRLGRFNPPRTCLPVVAQSDVRNAYAHGRRRIDESAAQRLRAAGMTSPARGDVVVLDYPTLKVFRGRLRALMDLGEIGRETN